MKKIIISVFNPKVLGLLFSLVAIIHSSEAQKKTISGADESFTIENYYRIKWGYADEFIKFYISNHYPLLKKAQEKGDILSISAEKPQLHASEDSRWDFKVTIVFRNVQAAFDPDLVEPYKKQLFPDGEKLAKEEQHRFELVVAHWDIATQRVELDK